MRPPSKPTVVGVGQPFEVGDVLQRQAVGQEGLIPPLGPLDVLGGPQSGVVYVDPVGDLHRQVYLDRDRFLPARAVFVGLGGVGLELQDRHGRVFNQGRDADEVVKGEVVPNEPEHFVGLLVLVDRPARDRQVQI